MKYFILCLTVVFYASTSFAEKITAVQDAWPPFTTGDSSSPGISVELVTEALKTQGYELSVEIQPWARAIDNVKKGKRDILLAAWYTDERAGFLNYSQAYAQNSVKFISTKESSITYSGQFDSLTGKKVGTEREYGYGSEFQNATAFSKHETSGLVINIKKMIAGRIDLTLGDEIVSKAILAKQNPGLIDQIKFLEPPLSKKDLFIASGKDNKKSQEIIAAFNKGLEEIRQNGTYEKILSKYH